MQDLFCGFILHLGLQAAWHSNCISFQSKRLEEIQYSFNVNGMDIAQLLIQAETQERSNQRFSDPFSIFNKK